MLTRRPRLILAVSVVLASAISCVTILLLTQMREDALRRAQDAANNVSLLVERDTERNLQIADLSIQAVIEQFDDPVVRKLDPSIRQRILFDRAATAKDLSSILVTDAKGDVIADSESWPPLRQNVANHSYFIAHRQSSTVGLFISGPSIMPHSDSGPVIALSRRLSNPDGSFAGVVVGGLKVDYFRRLFAGMKLGPSGSMALMLADGTMLMRRPFDRSIIGRPLAGTSNYTRFSQTSRGEFFGVAAIDGVERWYTFRHIGNFPLILDVALARDDIFSQWRRRAAILGSSMAGLAIGLVGIAAVLAQQLTRRQSAEVELRRLAQTDGLTQLANRRAFEHAAELERVHPHGPLSVVMIDVDYFKQFNDTYGHAVGDSALISVADCVAANMRRSDALAARYGGEEFVVLLRNTTCEEAVDVAQRICDSVKHLATPHAASPYGVLTVSVGVAGRNRKMLSAGPQAMLEEADAALYQAKSTGRNCVAKASSCVPEKESTES